jgi:DNA polymerase-3 subunit epsilon
MREICLDTETTGLDPKDDHKIIEIGCVELINKVKTGNNYHVYVNPKRDVPEGAFKVHGISTEFLTDKPEFKKIAQDFINFIKDSKLIIHNAAFDMKFINFELRQCGLEIIERNVVIDSLQMARNKFPGAGNTLDALCKRFGIDTSKRTKHGALLDAELLCEVYLELTGGNQYSMFGNGDGDQDGLGFDPKKNIANKVKIPYRDFPLSEDESRLHQEYIKKNLKENSWGYS